MPSCQGKDCTLYPKLVWKRVRHRYCGGASWPLAPYGQRNCLLASTTDRRTQIAHREQVSFLHNASLGIPFLRCHTFPIEQLAMPLSLPHYLETNFLVVIWSPNHVRTIGSTVRRTYLAPGWFREPKFEKDYRSSISCPTQTFATL